MPKKANQPTPAYPKAQTTYKPCHTDGTLVFVKDGTEFYAGKYSGVSARSYDLIIDLAKSVTSNVSGTNMWGKVGKFADSLSAQILHINWPDYGIISWERDKFEQLLAAIKADKLTSVYICCVGGHGRTGTMMSILAGLSNAVPDGQCPVTWLRGVYCDNVVESEKQLGYVEAITEMKVTAEPGKVYGAYQQNWGAQNYKGSKGSYGGSYVPPEYKYGAPWQQKVYGNGGVKSVSQYDGEYSEPQRPIPF
jgi:hypothetical protein